jgi:FkbM family methyltransferase
MSWLGDSALVRPVRHRMGGWLHSRIDVLATRVVRRELLAEREARLRIPQIWGPPERVSAAPTAQLNDALLNTISGDISVAEDAFLGHGVALLTGTHDIRAIGPARQVGVPVTGRDIVIESGAWVASRAVVLGPCRIGAHAVIAAGTVVDADVPPRTIVAGSPAGIVGRIDAPHPLPAHARVITDVGTLLVHPHDEVITPALRQNGTWDPDDSRLMERDLRPGGVVVDVGANIGYMTLVAAHAVGPAGTVVAIEPHPDNVALLKQNLRRNGVADRVTVVAAAAWCAPGSVQLAEAAQNTGDHRVNTKQTERRQLDVPAVTLDEVIAPDLHVDLIKLDTQATELAVLDGARALLARDRPIILYEFWPQGLRERADDPAEVLIALRNLGYRIEIPGRPGLADLDDEALVTATNDAGSAPNFGFVTLRLVPL